MIKPLADRIRPLNLNQFVGQSHLVGEYGPIRQMVENKKIFSMVFWGPTGVGKTTLARIIALEMKLEGEYLSAVSAGKDDLRRIVKDAQTTNQPRLLFLDEIHRFNKAQQDYLLPFVESGELILIGATTENPSFEVISPLLSRCQVFVLNELNHDELKQIINDGEKELKVKLENIALEYIVAFANGDARKALNLLDNTYELNHKKIITLSMVKNALQSKLIRYDKGGEEHYNTISSYIKSMRASNVDASLYYLARMVNAGEDPLFIARRMVVFASEDVASPTALVVANAVFRACETIGYPECQENLAAGTVYLAQSKKDRRSYDAYMKALEDVKAYGNLPIPMNLRNAPTKLMKKLGYGKGYDKYTDKDLLPEKLEGKRYYDQ